jgi:hypothetical protein
MAGSISYQVYQSDNGQNYAIRMDRSNALAVNASASATPAALPAIELPKNIKPRYALYTDATGNIKRKVVLLKPSDVAALVANASLTPPEESATLRITFVVGEKIRLPKLADTGRTN